MRRRAVLAAAALLTATALPAPASAEVAEIRIGRAPGLAFLPLFVMEAGALVEKHAAAAGLKPAPVKWLNFTGGSDMNDALLSGNLEFANGGVLALLTLWSRALGTPSEVRAVAAVSDVPSTLTTVNPAVKTLRDLTERDRISVAAVKNSQVAILLQMAAEKEFGAGQRARLDPLTVSMPQPDSVAAMLSGRTEVTAQFTVLSFANRELRDPKFRAVIRSTDILGGVNTIVVAYATSRFRSGNPSIFKVYLAALAEACALIAADRRRAAMVYSDASRDRMPLDELLEIMSDPALRYTSAPTATMVFAELMHRIGSIPRKPAAWTDMFFADVRALPGS